MAPGSSGDALQATTLPDLARALMVTPLVFHANAGVAAMHALPMQSALLTMADFSEHIDRLYRVDATPAPVDMRLDLVKPGPANPLNFREPFMLMFSTPIEALLTAGHYRLRAPDGRIIGIDLIPTQTTPGPRRCYHAVFT